MNAPVFLSFASKDRKAAETICKAVEQRGLKCWIATRDIGPGGIGASAARLGQVRPATSPVYCNRLK